MNKYYLPILHNRVPGIFYIIFCISGRIDQKKLTLQFLNYSDQATRALGWDELEGHAAQVAAGRDAGRQPEVRGQAPGGRGLGVQDGDQTREDASRRSHRRRPRGTTSRAKGNLLNSLNYNEFVYFFILEKKLEFYKRGW